jgi:microsomal dipeptidase-like Zn-dependent dipeptidase
MFTDLHAHYPMRVLTGVEPDSASKEMLSPQQEKLGERIKAAILRLAHRIGNAPDWDGTYRIDVEKLRQGKVDVAMSVLFRALQEMDLTKSYASPPDPAYFDLLMEDLEAVEEEVAGHGPDKIRIAHNRLELENALEAKVPALVHAVEGGFHLGYSDAEIEANCAKLAERGVGYVTVAHLFFRQVATNANAVPFIPNFLYDLLFPQRVSDRLTPRGETLVRSLIENRILVDLSHMDPPALDETLRFMDTVDPDRTMPVISTHAGYRFNPKHLYMHDAKALQGIRDRGGVVGLIMAQHQLYDGRIPKKKRKQMKTIEDSLPVVFDHIDKIAAVMGRDGEPLYDHIAFGTDLDGFIKPTIDGIEYISDLPKLEEPLRKRYGDEVAEGIMGKNALRVLRQLWPETA